MYVWYQGSMFASDLARLEGDNQITDRELLNIILKEGTDTYR